MIIGVYGYQDAGKTKLVESLVRALVAKGYSVSSIKHTPHDKSIDCEGKDTWRHWKAGSDPVAFSSRSETAIIKHSSTPTDDIVEMIMDRFHPDVLVVEGFKDGSFPKVAIGRVGPRTGTVLRNPSLATLVRYIKREVAVERAMDQLPGLDCGKCGLDCEGLARAIAARKRALLDCRELSYVRVDLRIDGDRIPMGRFASSVVDNTVRGMLAGLKGYKPNTEVEIHLTPKRGKAKRSRRRK